MLNVAQDEGRSFTVPLRRALPTVGAKKNPEKLRPWIYFSGGKEKNTSRSFKTLLAPLLFYVVTGSYLWRFSSLWPISKRSHFCGRVVTGEEMYADLGGGANTDPG